MTGQIEISGFVALIDLAPAASCASEKMERVVMSMQWLLARVPGFNNLSDEERSAIVDFSLLWSLFEARILANSGKGGRDAATNHRSPAS